MEQHISMYIDNELDLDQKISFVEQCHHSRQYSEQAVSLLQQEKQLHAYFNETGPDILLPPDRRLLRLSRPALNWALAACLLLVLTVMFVNQTAGPDPSAVEPALATHRFIIYQQEAEQVEITGTFTGWQRVPLLPAGSKGYWEIFLQVPEGEHRYSYIINGREVVADPTTIAMETDDFGTANSILHIKI